MIIIGERINSTKAKVQEAIKGRNIQFILKEASAQLAAGADFIDINCAVTSGDEVLDMDWIVSIIQGGIKNVSLCIDSPNYLAIEKALAIYKAKGRVMINSITADEERVEKIVTAAVRHDALVVALTMDERGMPDDARGRFDIAARILGRVKQFGFKEENLYFDPLIRPISTEPKQAAEFLKSIPMIKGLGNVRTICGLSNVSFGLPNRRLVNSAFLAMAMAAGLDAAILDPLDGHVMSAAAASKALLGDDEYCAAYIKSFRDGKLV